MAPTAGLVLQQPGPRDPKVADPPLTNLTKRKGLHVKPSSQTRSTRTDDDAAALRRFADLMDEDNARTNRVGIPVSHGHYLLSQAVSGASDEWDAEWIRLARTESRQAAIEWAEREEAQLQRLIRLVYPGGATACSKSAAEVRSMADDLAARCPHVKTKAVAR